MTREAVGIKIRQSEKGKEMRSNAENSNYKFAKACSASGNTGKMGLPREYFYETRSWEGLVRETFPNVFSFLNNWV